MNDEDGLTREELQAMWEEGTPVELLAPPLRDTGNWPTITTGTAGALRLLVRDKAMP